ncbi:apolipoprotein A-IV [Candoia aspera]|uniref:apolipoprotein A-IV n=1 Tax=Candoia aspera TaxID=51853 RepID=UPI002FD8681A
MIPQGDKYREAARQRRRAAAASPKGDLFLRRPCLPLLPATMAPKAVAFLLLSLLAATAGAQDSLTPRQLADVVWQYFTQLGSSAEETVRQAQQLDITKQLSTLIQDNLQAVNTYTEEMKKKLVPYITQLHAQLGEEGEKVKERIRQDLQQLQTDIGPFAVEVQNQMVTIAENLKGQLVLYTGQLQATADTLAAQTSDRLASLVQELQAKVKENVGDLPAALSPYVDRLRQTINEQVGDIKGQLALFPEELKAKADQAVEELHRLLSLYAQTSPEQLKRQLEGLSFQVAKSAEGLRGKLLGEAERLREELGTLLQGDLVPHLGNLKGDIGQQIEEFRQRVGSYAERFNQLMVQRVQELGLKLQPHASGVDDYLSFLEKEVQDRIVTFTDALQQAEALLPTPEA